ncbi:glycosyltransferase [Vicingaceae bacterium]|jgi:glycosyltransferase involved in cell wall biosynthesis|nr:glycosyltransferase [Vicingaceae bacterium]
MKISIITVCYNSEKTIADCITSVVNQSYDNLEYIVIDGKSTDTTMEIIASFGDQIFKVVSEKDKGMYDAINKGIRMASGDIIGVLNSDDYYTDGLVIEDVMSKFNEANADALYADLNYVDQIDTNNVVRYWKSGDYKPNSFLSGWMPPHPTFFIRKEWYLKYGEYSLELVSAADYELMLRMVLKHGARLAYLPRVIVNMRVGGMSNSSLRNRLRANKEDRKAWEMNGLTPKYYTLIFKPLRKIIQYVKR